MAGETGLLMETLVFSTTPTKASTADVMAIFNTAHSVIHGVFVGMTKPISETMRPLGAD
jgi:hypothetical protein